jgi:hypothetical protein
MKSNGRVKPDAFIADLDTNGVIGPEREMDIDTISVGVFNRVEYQFTDRLKEDDASVTRRGVGVRVRAHSNHDAVLILRPSCEPFQGGRETTQLQHGRKEIHAQ